MRRNQSGMTLAEVLMSVAMVGVLIYATLVVTGAALIGTKNNEDKQFATQKALSILEELKSVVQTNSGTAITVLDGYDDGTAYFNRLTIVGNKLTGSPGDSTSANIPVGSDWLYSRQISVKPLTDPTNPSVVIGSSDVRLVRVRVYKNDPKGGGPRLLAEVASVVRTLAVSFPPSQVYDVYCIAIENVPGWWVNMASLIPYVQNAISDLQNRQPGLVFRPHWITKLAYGRDTQYVPYVNATNGDPSCATPADCSPNPAPVKSVYFYPGTMPTTYTPEAGGTAITPPAAAYYPQGNFKAMIRTESGIQNGFNASTNSNPYTLADMYNNAMRYPDELALYNRRVNAKNALNAPIYPDEEMTLRLLLDDMYMNPNKYTNAILINLHGELLPFPPVRNYSDAAKKPDFYHGDATHQNGVRAVTHPEMLSSANTDDVQLRVYSYVTNPNNVIYKFPGGVPTALWTGGVNQEFLPEPITVVLRGINWNPAQTGTDFVKAITGGVDFTLTGAARSAYSTVVPTPTTDAASPAHRMYFTRTYIGPVAPATVGDTVIKLYNSPVVSPCLVADCSTGGLATHRRLYGMEYIPSPMEDFTSGAIVAPFQAANNLDSAVDIEKNTARWLIHIPASAFTNNATWTIETRIGDYDASTSPGTFTPAYTEPPDVSVTYNWRGDATWLYGNATTSPAMPMSERFQFQGDPRHLPYADLKMPHTTNSGAWTGNPTDGLGYNQTFDDFQNTADGNKTGAEYIGSIIIPPAGVNVLATNKVCSVKIDGTATTINLTTGSPRTAAQIATDLNGGLSNATVDVVNGRIRITSDRGSGTVTPNSSVQFNAPAANCNALLGFDTTIRYRPAWDGWFYTYSSALYGIKNDIYPDNELWATSNGGLEVDVPRVFQFYRQAMMRTNSLFTTMTGFPYYYLGIGNEIGYDDANGWPDNVPVSRRPFDGTDTPKYFENTITPGKTWGDCLSPPLGGMQPSPCGSSVAVARSGVKYIEEGDNSWWSMPWIGELYPDKMYNVTAAGSTDWKDFGNLPTANVAGGVAVGAGNYQRVQREDVPGNTAGDPSHTLGTTFNHTVRRLHEQGMPTFFWTGGATGVLAGGGTNGTLAAPGTEIDTNYNFPLQNPIPANRAFSLTASLPSPLNGWALPVYGLANTVSNLATFYNSDAGGSNVASALIPVRQGTTTSAMFVVENGLAASFVGGTDYIARWAFLSLIQGFLQGGSFNTFTAPAVAQVPRIAVTNPNPNSNLTDPTSITVSWSQQWKRWDGIPYTSAYAASYAPSPAPAMSYFIMYSPDNGLTWRYVQDNAPAVPGTRLSSSDPHKVGTTTYNWSVPCPAFQAGAYIIRVEAYRDAFPLHYAFHQYQCFINRTGGC